MVCDQTIRTKIEEKKYIIPSFENILSLLLIKCELHDLKETSQLLNQVRDINHKDLNVSHIEQVIISLKNCESSLGFAGYLDQPGFQWKSKCYCPDSYHNFRFRKLREILRIKEFLEENGIFLKNGQKIRFRKIEENLANMIKT